jgi:hypothetical protein
MKTKELRQELESLGIQTRSFVEKIEFINALVHARSNTTSSFAPTGTGGSTTSSDINHPSTMGTKALRQE